MFRKLSSSLTRPQRSSDDTIWSLLPRRGVLDALRSARRDMVERWMWMLLRWGRRDRYETALKYACAYGGNSSAVRSAVPLGAASWALLRFTHLGRLRQALPWPTLSTGGITAGGIAALGGVAGVLLLAGGQAGLTYTNSERFCVSCHEMRDMVYAEYKGTIHDANRSGVRATCSDCHVPREIGPMLARKVGAAVDLYSHFVSGAVDTKEKFEDQRYRMARTVWVRMKANDSQECRNCHDAAAMSSDLQSAGTRARHARGKAQGKTCIDCHFGIAHKEPQDGPGPQELTVER